MRTNAERVAQAMIDTLELRDVENGYDISKLLTAGFMASEVAAHIDYVREQVRARRVVAGGEFSAGVAIALAAAILIPDVAHASDGIPVAHAWGYAIAAMMVGGIIGAVTMAVLAMARDADDRAGFCPLDQRLPTGSCLTCGAQRGDRCRGEGA